MGVFIVIAIPMVLVLGIWSLLWYGDIKHPSPIALGCALGKVCVVSAEEIHDYCETNGQEGTEVSHLRRDAAWKRVTVARKYVGQMLCNTKLIQQVARFEALKIDPAKSSLEYKTKETLALRLVDESAAVRSLLIKSHISLTIRAFTRVAIKRQALEKLLQLTMEYKQLEQDALIWVGMATDRCYYAMLAERLGLSNWGLIDGGSGLIDGSSLDTTEQ